MKTKTNSPRKHSTRRERALYAAGLEQGQHEGLKRGYEDGYLKGKAEGIKEAQAKYNLQNTILEAMKQQTAGMEMLTRLSSAIAQLNGGRGVM